MKLMESKCSKICSPDNESKTLVEVEQLLSEAMQDSTDTVLFLMQVSDKVSR